MHSLVLVHKILHVIRLPQIPLLNAQHSYWTGYVADNKRQLIDCADGKETSQVGEGGQGNHAEKKIQPSVVSFRPTQDRNKTVCDAED